MEKTYRPHKFTGQVFMGIGILILILMIYGETRSRPISLPGSVGGDIGFVIGFLLIPALFIGVGLLLYRIKRPLKDKKN